MKIFTNKDIKTLFIGVSFIFILQYGSVTNYIMEIS